MNVAFTAVPESTFLESTRGRALSPALFGTVRTLFDRLFYSTRYPDVDAAGIDGLDHFLTCGLLEGRTPHPLFDPLFYSAQLPADAQTMPPFLHYLHHGAANQLDPHPLFDTSYYIEQTESLTLFGQLPLSHFMTSGTRAQLSPNPLFDAAYYRRINQLGAAHPRHPILHYLAQGGQNTCRTHPLFDVRYYLSLRPDVAKAGVDPLAHYLLQGCHEGTPTHELFDLAFYRSGFDGSPADQDAIDAGGGIIHYATHTGRDLPSPHPLFDPAYYRATHSSRDPRQTAQDPFLHFIEHGLPAHLDPHPLFDSDFYAERYPQTDTPDEAPFLHFVRHGARQGRDPGPFFDALNYLSLFPQAGDRRFGAVSHYLAREPSEPAITGANFDAAFYGDCVRSAGLEGIGDLLLHFLKAGRELGFTPTAPSLASLGWVSISREPGPAGLKSPNARPILLISPDAAADPIATRALRAAECLNQDADVAVHVALLRSGPLQADFESAAPTLVLAQKIDAVRMLHAFARDAVDGIVIINSAAMPEIVSLAGRLGLGILAWLHEMPVAIDSLLGGSETVDGLLTHARRIITASHHARGAICRRYGAEETQVAVLRNGLDGAAEPSASNHAATTDEARALGFAVRAELGMPPDGLLVLSGGAVDFRSGADLFIQVAHSVVQRTGDAAGSDCRVPSEALALAQAHFVWVGEQTDRLFNGLCQHDVQQLGLGGRVHFLTGHSQMSRLLRTADLFLMTARTEAFDEAAIRASAAGVKLIGFEGCVSPADLPAGRKIGLVPYLDVEAMASSVITLGRRPARRKPRLAKRDLANSDEEAASYPSWAQWNHGLRLILRHEFSIAG